MLVGSPPERIYLQVEDECTPLCNHETTWAEDRVNDRDIEYVRADLVTVKENS